MLQEQAQPFEGLGSGVIIDAAKGYALTNNHVISQAQKNQRLSLTMAANLMRSWSAKHDQSRDRPAAHKTQLSDANRDRRFR